MYIDKYFIGVKGDKYNDKKNKNEISALIP